MLSVSVMPRRGTALRSALATAEITTALVAAHTWAGGSLPSPAWIALMAAVVLGAGLLVLRGRVRLLYAVPALTAVQLLLHGWLVALSPTDHAAAGMSGMSGMAGGAHAGHLELGAPMLLAHAAGALATALVWHLRGRAVDVLVAWSDTGLAPLPSTPRPRPVAAPVPTHLRARLRVAPLRGPPGALAPA